MDAPHATACRAKKADFEAFVKPRGRHEEGNGNFRGIAAEAHRQVIYIDAKTGVTRAGKVKGTSRRQRCSTCPAGGLVETVLAKS